MINSKIIRIASITKNVGLKKIFTHKSTIKNSLCGDIIKTEFIVDKSIVKSMRYETKSCILCEASASLFSRKIKNVSIDKLIREIKIFKNFKENKHDQLPHILREFSKLINKKNINRINCVILPMDAFLKAFNIK